MSRLFVLVLFLFALLPIHAEFSEPKEAWIINRARDYRDIIGLKKNAQRVYVVEHTPTLLRFGLFADDKQPQSQKPWGVFDILYADVPASYEIALSFLGREEYQKALEQFEKSANENTQVSKERFSGTAIGELLIKSHLLDCHVALGNKEKAMELYREIYEERKAHTWVRDSAKYADLLSKAGKGAEALQVAETLTALEDLDGPLAVDLSFFKTRSLAVQGSYDAAREELKRILDTYKTQYPEVEQRAFEMEADIIVYYEKNYDRGIDFFQKIIEENPVNAGAGVYLKLGECYLQTRKHSEAMWNLMKAYLATPTTDKETLASIVEKVEEVSKEMDDPQQTKAIDRLFKNIKSTL